MPMRSTKLLRLMWGAIFVFMLIFTTWVSLQQPLWAWGGLVRGPDRWWTIQTMCDAYFAMLTVYVWVFLKERSWWARGLWFVGFMTLGNLMLAPYMLLQLSRLGPDESVRAMFTVSKS
jgi:hypothetical protein